MKNVSREFATMDDDERRRFALENPPKDSNERTRPLDFENPRDEDHMGRHVMEDDPLRGVEEEDEAAEAGGPPEDAGPAA